MIQKSYLITDGIFYSSNTTCGHIGEARNGLFRVFVCTIKIS